MARPQRISDEQILKGTRSCVLKEGASVSLQCVAQFLGVTAPALLRRFRSRTVLMTTALKPPSPALLVHTITVPPSDADVVVQLETRFVALWEFLSEVVPCAMALRENGVPADAVCQWSDGPQKVIEAFESWLKVCVEKGFLGSHAMDTAATAMLGAIQARVLGTHLTKSSFALRYHRVYLHDLAVLFARALAP